jgi:hypothetical protein
MRFSTRLLFGFALGFLVLVVLLALAPRPMERRLATLQGDGLRLAAIDYRIRSDPRPIDVAFLGSSHVVNGVDDQGLEQALAAQGTPATVANLGMFVMGRDLHLLLTKALIAYKRPKLIVLEINEHEASKGHPYMPYIGAASDLVAAGLPLNLPQMFLLHLKQQALGIADAVLPGREPLPVLPRAAYGWQPIDMVWSGQMDAPSLGDRLQARFGPQLRARLYRATSHYGDVAVVRIVALAHAHGVRVIFLYLPEYKYAADPDPQLLVHYRRLGPVVVIPRDVALDRADWFDHSHLNVEGTRRLAPTLAAAIAQALKP